VALTSLAVTGLPSWNLASVRSVKVQVCGSGVAHFVASEGLNSPVAASRETSWSKICLPIVSVGPSSEFAPVGSRESTLFGCATRSVPEGCLAAVVVPATTEAAAAVGAAVGAACGAAGAAVATVVGALGGAALNPLAAVVGFAAGVSVA